MAALARLFVVDALAAGRAISLDEAASNYLARVMRLQTGDAARLFNGRDGEWRALISQVNGKKVQVTPDVCLRPQPVSHPPHLTLMFAPVKKDATDFIVEKATELGVAVLQPVITAFTQSAQVRVDRFRKIALEAAEQSERLDVPEIAALLPLERALAALPGGTQIIFCDEDAGALPIADVLSGRTEARTAMLIGPEGGFSPDERAALRARADTFAVSLGPRILRAETAVVAALAVFQAICGDAAGGRAAAARQ
jgi:16S rRNA (uracil1498-N3)-methyltransferase